MSLVFSGLLPLHNGTAKPQSFSFKIKKISKMKKLVYLAIVGLSFGAFSACSSGESQNTEEPSLESDPEEEADAGLDGGAEE